MPLCVCVCVWIFPWKDEPRKLENDKDLERVLLRREKECMKEVASSEDEEVTRTTRIWFGRKRVQGVI